MSITIRTAHNNDISTLVEFWQQIDAFPQSERPFGGDAADKPKHSEQLLRRTLQSADACVLVATDKQLPIGTISGHVFEKPAVNISKVGVIYSLWLDEKYRGQGIAQQLLTELEAHLAAKGAKAFQVGWDSPNQVAAQWWQKRGYCPYEVIASKIV